MCIITTWKRNCNRFWQKKITAHLTKTSVNFCDNIYDGLKLFPFRRAYFYSLVNYLVQFVFEPQSYLNKNPKYVGINLWKFKHVHKKDLDFSFPVYLFAKRLLNIGADTKFYNNVLKLNCSYIYKIEFDEHSFTIF